jgi:hypothetical protein
LLKERTALEKKNGPVTFSSVFRVFELEAIDPHRIEVRSGVG